MEQVARKHSDTYHVRIDAEAERFRRPTADLDIDLPSQILDTGAARLNWMITEIGQRPSTCEIRNVLQARIGSTPADMSGVPRIRLFAGVTTHTHKAHGAFWADEGERKDTSHR